MKLYYFETPNGRKACAAAKYLDLPVEFLRIDLTAQQQKTPEFLAVNPNGKIPALTDGAVKMWESNAIMCYLADKAGSDFWPRDERAVEVIRWLSWDAVHFSRHASTFTFQNVIKPHFGLGTPDARAIEEATGFFLQFAAVLDAHLKERRYIVGDALSVADFALAAHLPTAELAKLPLDGFPEIQRWHALLNELPAWREPFPSDLARTA
jgi:glutathione S-transferase